MSKESRRVLVTGASGQLGAYLLRELRRTGRDVVAWSGASTGERDGVALLPVDLTDAAAVRRGFELAAPEVVIHAAAVSTPVAVHRDPAQGRAVNVEATCHLVGLAAARGVRFVLLSTDMVFDGSRGGYTEADAPTPSSQYGRTKVEAERIVAAYDRALALRLSLLFGPSLHGRPTLLDQQAAAMRRGEAVKLFDDEHRTPLALPIAAEAIVAAAGSDVTGLLHLGGAQRMSRYEMGRGLCEHLGADPACLRAVSRLSIESAEPRPADCSLDSTRFYARFPEIPRFTFRAALGAMRL